MLESISNGLLAPELLATAGAVSMLGLPVMAFVTLLINKLSAPTTARLSEWIYFGTLIIVTLATLRAMLHNSDHWLLCTVTLAGMILGGLLIPGNREPEEDWLQEEHL